MILTVDPRSAVPPFEQVRVQVVELARSGGLRPGDRLPTVRRLAGDLGIAANTVARAYRELEQAGVVETRGRKGTFVAMTGDRVEREAQSAAMEFAGKVRRLGVAPTEALRLVRSALGVDATLGEGRVRGATGGGEEPAGAA